MTKEHITMNNKKNSDHFSKDSKESQKDKLSQKENSKSHFEKKEDSQKTKKKPSPFFNKNLETEKLKKELKEVKSSYSYLQAEFANFKRIQQNEREQSIKYASSSFLNDFLINVLNDFNRAMEKEWEESDFKDFKSGIGIIHSKIIKVLQKNGVKEINPQGEIFDPRFHEVLSLGEDQSLPEQTVLQVCKKGYLLHDRLVQPAQVIVNQFLKNKKSEETEKKEQK